MVMSQMSPSSQDRNCSGDFLFPFNHTFSSFENVLSSGHLLYKSNNENINEAMDINVLNNEITWVLTGMKIYN